MLFLLKVRARMAMGQCGCHKVHVMLAVQNRAALDPFIATLQVPVVAVLVIVIVVVGTLLATHCFLFNDG
jgi:hypothetical protein